MTTPVPTQADLDAAVFVEHQCAVGGSYCAAWDKWFWASVEADPACNDEDRDPKPLTNYPFDIADCHDIGRCRLRAAAIRNTENTDDK